MRIRLPVSLALMFAGAGDALCGAGPDSRPIVSADTASASCTVQVRAEVPLFNAVAEVPLDGDALLRGRKLSGAFDPRSLIVYELDANGRHSAAPVPHQLEPPPRGANPSTLLVYLAGATSAGTTRKFEVRLGPATRAHDPQRLITVIDDATDVGEPAFKIVTPNAFFFIQKKSHGVSTLIDRDGANWIGFNPGKGSSGEFRGLPNITPVEFHPGKPTGKKDLRLVSTGALKAVFEGATLDDKWKTRWEVYPAYTRIVVTAPGDTPYWLLYEGTPAGKLEPERQYVLLGDGTKHPLTARWQRDLPGPEWAAFGDNTKPRVLFVAHPEDDDLDEQYWPMEGNMTVFGFGRGTATVNGRNRSAPLLTAAKSTMLFGIIEANQPEEIARQVQSALTTVKGEILR